MEIRVWALAALWVVAVFTLSSAQEGGVPAELCPPGGGFCSEDGLEIVFESGTSTHDGPLEPGTEIPIRVVLDARSAGIQGYSWAVKHDPEHLALLPESVTTAGTIIDPEHPNTVVSDQSFNATFAVPGGFISAIVLALYEKREMPPGRHAICRATYRVEKRTPCTGIRFVHLQLATPGSPPVALNVTVFGQSKQARHLRHGRVGSGACPETCDDGADNDGDGLPDCADPDCANADVCGEEICADGIDNDADSRIDCLDPSCRDQLSCQEECTDGIDNDSNGLVDGDDPDCFLPEPPGPRPPVETCDDGVDNDGDLRADCDDNDCIVWLGPCWFPEICDDGKDNDRDSRADCNDRDCAGNPACPDMELCADGKDNDADGAMDCYDPDCASERPCIEDCADGIDNDRDGFVDALDRSCSEDDVVIPGGAPLPTSYIRGDTDGNGRVNVLDAIVILRRMAGETPAFDCMEALNTNADGGVDAADALFVLRWVFLQGPPLPQPFPGCGFDASGGCTQSSPGC
jgi:hypothetical protein